MALQIEYFDEAQQLQHDQAYLRLASGEFTSDTMHLLVNIYASAQARQKEKEYQDCLRQIDISMEASILANRELGELSEHFSELQKSYSELKNKEGTDQPPDKTVIDKMCLDLAEAMQGFENKLALLNQVRSQEILARAQISTMPIIQPCQQRKYTFQIDPEQLEQHGLFGAVYEMIKTVPDFVGAVDI